MTTITRIIILETIASASFGFFLIILKPNSMLYFFQYHSYLVPYVIPPTF